MRTIKLSTIEDSRGALTSIEEGVDIPFDIKRCYIVHHIMAARGGHAHPENQQLVFAAAGKIRMDLNDGSQSKSFWLNDPSVGVLIDSMTWIELLEFSEDAALVVLASTHYDHSKTIRNWDEFMRLIG